jgi:hypothetical protein
MPNLFYRNVDARDLLDAFFISAVSSLLLVRFYLHITGYPQIGSGGLHIAHMLWGGALMTAAIVVNITFLGNRSRWFSAVAGGVGFGVFIDELGKFITEDNNYFFEPAIGIIYAVFVSLYLLFNFITRHARFTSSEYHMNVLTKLEEAIAYDLSRAEKADIQAMLKASNQKSEVTKALREFVSRLTVTAKSQPGFMEKLSKRLEKNYERLWLLQQTHTNYKILFVVVALIITAGIGLTVVTNINDVMQFFDGTPTYGQEVLLGQVVSATIAGIFVLAGVWQLASSRLDALEQFRRASLITIYLTQFFAFIRLEFQALPGLIASIIILTIITFVIHQEKRLRPR